MNLALEQFADNPIIDELVFWPPKNTPVSSVRASNVMFRRPFIEVEMQDGEVFHRHFARDSFAEFWAEACVILETLTRIELISDFAFKPVDDRENLVRRALAARDECIVECDAMYQQGMYAQYLMQFGEDCRDLPPATQKQLDHARAALAAAS